MQCMIKHKEFGIFQGAYTELGLWHPFSKVPEYGLYAFDSAEEANECIEFLCSDEYNSSLHSSDIEILPFDNALSSKLHSLSVFARPYVSVWQNNK